MVVSVDQVVFLNLMMRY